MKIILLIMIGLSGFLNGFLNADFTKVGNVVTDSKTGLVWQDDAVGSEMNWQAVIDYCEALSLDSFSDWRLPNVNELKSIVDRSKSQPAIVDGFTNTQSSYYWSSTSLVAFEEDAWVVGFRGGNVDGGDKVNNYYVRCVRGGQ